MSTMLLMGRTPLARSRWRIHRGEGPIFTLRTIRAVYRGHSSGFSISTSSSSATLVPSVPFTWGSGRLRGTLKVAALSRARPMTLRQSGRLGVISNSTTWSSRPSRGTISSPGWGFLAMRSGSLFRRKMPLTTLWGQSWSVIPSSW